MFTPCFLYAALLVLLESLILTFFFLFLFCEALLCCLIWVTIFLWCSTSHKHSPHSTSLLCGLELGQKLLQCSARRLQPFMVHELLVSWYLKQKKFVVFCYLYFMLAKCTYCFSIAKRFDKGLCDCATLSSLKVAWATVAVSWKASFYEKCVLYRYWHSFLCLTLLAGIFVCLE